VEADRAVLNGFVAAPPHGTTMFLSVGMPDAEPFLARLRAEQETSAVPGKFFEMPGHIRIGMGVDHEMFAEGAKRLFSLLPKQ
jgi:aspartate/methionine/tyrosine aminotransferase